MKKVKLKLYLSFFCWKQLPAAGNKVDESLIYKARKPEQRAERG